MDVVVLDTDTIVIRFLQNTAARLKPSTQRQYILLLNRFDRYVHLKTVEKGELTGKNGKALILGFLNRFFDLRSWKFVLAGLKTVYISGMELEARDWPIEPRRDLPRFPRTGRQITPSNEIVKQWNDAVRNESDPEIRLVWLLVAQHGWRPTHLLYLNWEDVVKRDGQPWAIVAQKREFKTGSPIMAWLASDVVEALLVHRGVLEKRGPVFSRLRELYRNGRDALNRLWIGIQRRWGLPYLRPNGLRHWVSHIGCDVAFLSRPALAALMGHDPSSGGWMSDWYNSPRTEEILMEQARKMPSGPLGFLDMGGKEEVDKDQELLVAWRRYLNDEITSGEFRDRAKAIKSRIGWDATVGKRRQAIGVRDIGRWP
jgi:integrase